MDADRPGVIESTGQITSVKVIVLAEAIAEMEAARDFYHQHTSPAVAARFLDQIERATARLVEHPYLGASVTPRLRRILLQQFPYSLIYQVANFPQINTQHWRG